MNITSWQHQIICGTLLGSGYISRTFPIYLGISESHNHKWLLFKGLELKNLQAKTPISRSGNVLKWRAHSDDIWSEYKSKFYIDNEKIVDMDIMNGLRDIALAVWFGDKGFWYSTRRVGLRTTAFGESNKVFYQFFNEVGMSCDMKKDSHGAFRIVFDRSGTKDFLQTIAHRLPDFMHCRLSGYLV